MKSRKKINELIDRFLSERKTSLTEQWPEVSNREVRQLAGILSALIERKYESDSEGALPIEFRLVDRTKCSRLHSLPVPYLHKAKTLRERLEILSVMATNAKMAAEALQTATAIVMMDEAR